MSPNRYYKVVVSREGEEIESPFYIANERVGLVTLSRIAFELCRYLRQSSGEQFGVFEQDDGSYLITAERYQVNTRQIVVRLLPVESRADPTRPVWKTVKQQRMVGEVGRFAFKCQHL